MTISVDDFMKKATKPQKELLFRLVDLGEKEAEAAEAFNKKIGPFREMAEDANPFKDGQYTKIIQGDAEDFGLIATREERNVLKGIREEIKETYKESLSLGMGELGIIQRNYEHYVGEKIPS